MTLANNRFSSFSKILKKKRDSSNTKKVTSSPSQARGIRPSGGLAGNGTAAAPTTKTADGGQQKKKREGEAEAQRKQQEEKKQTERQKQQEEKKQTERQKQQKTTQQAEQHTHLGKTAGGNPSGRSVASARCFRCNCVGHLAVDCRTPRAHFKPRPLESLSGSCRKCGNFGHYEGACRQPSAIEPREGPLTAFPFPPGGVGSAEFLQAKACAAALREQFRRDKIFAEQQLAETSRAIGRQEFVVTALAARGPVEQDEALARTKLAEAALLIATRFAETAPWAEAAVETFRRRTREDTHQCPFCFLGFPRAGFEEHVVRDHFGPAKAATADREAKQRQALEAANALFFNRLLSGFVFSSRETAARQKHRNDEAKARAKIEERCARAFPADAPQDEDVEGVPGFESASPEQQQTVAQPGPHQQQKQNASQQQQEQGGQPSQQQQQNTSAPTSPEQQQSGQPSQADQDDGAQQEAEDSNEDHPGDEGPATTDNAKKSKQNPKKAEGTQKKKKKPKTTGSDITLVTGGGPEDQPLSAKVFADFAAQAAPKAKALRLDPALAKEALKKAVFYAETKGRTPQTAEAYDDQSWFAAGALEATAAQQKGPSGFGETFGTENGENRCAMNVAVAVLHAQLGFQALFAAKNAREAKIWAKKWLDPLVGFTPFWTSMCHGLCGWKAYSWSYSWSCVMATRSAHLSITSS